MKKITSNALVVIFVLLSFSSFSQEVWRKTSVQNEGLKANKRQLPPETVFFTLNEETLKNNLLNAPERGTGAIQSNTIVSLPNAEGKMMDFYVVEASNFSPILQAKFPEIRAYRGIAVDNPLLSLNFSLSPLGLKAMIMNPGGKSIFIEPVTENNDTYAAYTKLPREKNSSFECLTEETDAFLDRDFSDFSSSSLNADDQVLRTFRLVVSVTGEYTNYFGGTVAGAMAAINATMTRVNAIYERDFAINMELIDNNDDVIYLDGNADPYSPSSSMNNWNMELQNNLTATIGNANYDIGHLFGATGGGGNAGCIGCVCENGKGSGYTSPADGIPEGDNFDIDYVAHEMGHQFGANHTFSRNEGSGANLEPGSGTTIMGYAGITGPTDVQAHSDDIFHYYSIFQVTENVEDKTCPEETPITNNPPTAYAGSNYTIPSGTAFKLTAIGSDPDGDPITYSWEQADLSTSSVFSFPDPNATTGPLFRVGQATTNPTRYFPALSEVLEGNLFSTWETVSNVSRNLNFVVQVRDNNPTVGQTASDNALISVDDTNGPFKITGFTENQSILPNTEHTLTWDVAGTNAAPFSSATVNILYSSDGGETFTTLASATANDGSESVMIPDETSMGAYFMVESVGNIFYAVSPKLLIGYEAVEICNTYEVTINSVPVSIPDGVGANTPGAYAVVGFDVPDFGLITDINVSVDVTHTYVNDLQIILQAPNSDIELVQVPVWNRECSNENDLDITFDDSGSSVICASPTTGTYEPSEPLSELHGMSTEGEWLFGVRDFYNGDTGTLNAVTLEVCSTEYTTMSTRSDQILESNLSVYPNPSKDFIKVSFKNNLDAASYVMYDMLGRVVYEDKDEANGVSEKTINVSHLSSGLYLLEISADGGKVTKKIIKE
ncbi:MAG TPA: zinc-dependent metalloprotease family protein [Salinimicrobium sp.]|nr:zinc-dependent metalloprotease family protein [Salinimicrobium sp.]